MTATAMLFDPTSRHEAGERTGPAPRHLRQAVRDPLIVFTVVMATAMLGIVLQPHGLLSSFWPANAVLLGLFLRAPSLARPMGWVAGIAGYLAADLAMGSALPRAMLLTAGNLAGVAVGFALLQRMPPAELRLNTAYAAMRMFLFVLAGAMSAGLVGLIINPALFGRDPFEGFLFWSVSEFTNYLAVLPVMLTARLPSRDSLAHMIAEADLMKAAPALACLLGLVMTTVAPGPAALVCPLPGLIWCALAYNVATVAGLSAAIAGWMLVGPAMPGVNMGIHVATHPDLLSFRFGVALVLLGPVSIAGVMAARNLSLREAAAAREAAERAMASRALLLATMTHELRSPLNIIAGYAQLIEKPLRGATEKQQTEYGQIIHEAATHMNALVTDLLDTAKVEAGQFTLSPQPTDSHAMMEQATRLVAGMAMERRIAIELAAGDWPMIHVDPRAIKQVAINLLSNAVKFSPPDAVVRVASRLTDGRLEISVSDRGPGISASDLERLGRPYQQAGDAARQKQGTGLGLALSMSLVAQHGGKLKLASAPDRGTTASFDLPLASAAAANDDQLAGQ